MSCKCKTVKGLPCKNKHVSGSLYCRVHQKCEKPVAKKVATKKVSKVTKKPSPKVLAKARGKIVRKASPDIYDLPLKRVGSAKRTKAAKAKSIAQKTNFTGIDDVDRIILGKLNGKDLFSVCRTSSRLRKICKNTKNLEKTLTMYILVQKAKHVIKTEFRKVKDHVRLAYLTKNGMDFTDKNNESGNTIVVLNSAIGDGEEETDYAMEDADKFKAKIVKALRKNKIPHKFEKSHEEYGEFIIVIG